MYEYKVKENNEDFNKIVIEKSNIKADFTFQDMKDEQIALQKHLKEFEANRKYKQLVLDNVKEHHDYVTKFSDEELLTISMYFEAKDKVRQYDEKIAEFESQLKESQDEMAHIKTTLDIHENIVLDPAFLKTEAGE